MNCFFRWTEVQLPPAYAGGSHPFKEELLSISAVRNGRARVLALTSEGEDWLSRGVQVVGQKTWICGVPEGDSAFRWYPFPALPCRALDSSVPPGLVCFKEEDVVISAVRHGRARLFLFTSEGGRAGFEIGIEANQQVGCGVP